MRPADLRPAGPKVPPGTTGLWRFDEGHGGTVGDASGHGHTLILHGGAGWTRGIDGVGAAHHGPRSVGDDVGPGDRHDELVHRLGVAQLRARRSVRDRCQRAGHRRLELLARDRDGRTGPAIVVGRGGHANRRWSLGNATWWTFEVPAVRRPAGSWVCGVQANLRYGDGRSDPAVGRWYQVTGVYRHGDADDRRVCRRDPRGRRARVRSPSGDGTADRRRGRCSDYEPTDTFDRGDRSGAHIRSGVSSPTEVWQLYRAERAPHGAGVRALQSTRSRFFHERLSRCNGHNSTLTRERSREGSWTAER